MKTSPFEKLLKDLSAQPESFIEEYKRKMRELSEKMQKK